MGVRHHGFVLAWPAEELIHRNKLILFYIVPEEDPALLECRSLTGRGGLLLSSWALL